MQHRQLQTAFTAELDWSCGCLNRTHYKSCPSVCSSVHPSIHVVSWNLSNY